MKHLLVPDSVLIKAAMGLWEKAKKSARPETQDNKPAKSRIEAKNKQVGTILNDCICNCQLEFRLYSIYPQWVYNLLVRGSLRKIGEPIVILLASIVISVPVHAAFFFIKYTLHFSL